MLGFFCYYASINLGQTYFHFAVGSLNRPKCSVRWLSPKLFHAPSFCRASRFKWIWYGYLSTNIQLFYHNFLSFFFFSQQLQSLDYNLCLLFMAVTSNVATISVYCYYGKMATESYKDMAYCLFESNWLYLPVELQKFFIMMIADAQIPLQYHAFHIVTLNLETLTKVSVWQCNC